MNLDQEIILGILLPSCSLDKCQYKGHQLDMPGLSLTLVG